MVVVGSVVVAAPSSPPVVVVPPTQFTSAWWTTNLGGDLPFGPTQIASLNDRSQSDLAPGPARAAATLATRIATAQVTGQGRSSYPDYFASGQDPATCTSIQVLAAAPLALPVRVAPTAPINTAGWSKTAVAYHATCSGEAATPPTDLQVTYVYAQWTGTGWTPTPSYLVPGAAAIDPPASPTPPAWDLTHFTTCGDPANAQFQDLIIVVDAFEAACTAAAAHGVHLRLASALRTPAAQAALFAQAVRVYGSVARARQWVEPATATSCASKHCSGTALDLVDTNAAGLTYLHAIVGCVTTAGYAAGPGPCPAGTTAVQRLQRYGFATPAAHIPAYLVFVLPTTTPATLNLCTPSEALPVPQIVASVFRCRLLAAGVPAADTQVQVSSALVVSRCESQWNTGAKAFGGAWSQTPNPTTGKTYTNAGLFLWSNDQATRYLPGGPGSLGDPVASANGAASLWLATRSWASYGCATGHGVFDTGPVLPQYGGPPLPGWALSF